jgi:hypothetical protein
MDTETTASEPRAQHGSNALVIFVTSLSAAICVAGGFGIVFEAFAVAAGGLFQLGQTFVWAMTAANAVLTVWLFLWCFARSWHVERRLKEGLEIDEPNFSILANLRGYGPSPSKP